MIYVMIYLILWLCLSLTYWILKSIELLPEWIESNYLPIDCVAVGVVGGVLYCLRAVYIHKCVENNWTTRWETWYYLRPITSGISGLVAYLFLQAGLIVLDATQEPSAANYGYFTIALIAGLNVDNFVKRIEEIALTTFGIGKSRLATKNKEE